MATHSRYYDYDLASGNYVIKIFIGANNRYDKKALTTTTTTTTKGWNANLPSHK